MKIVGIFIFVSFCLIDVHQTYLLPRIVGGEYAEEGDAPYIVSLRYNNYHDCGAFLISDTWILTAAHCAQRPTDTLSIQYGVLNITSSSDVDSSVIKIEEVISHPGFTSDGENDIAVMKLNKPVVLNDQVAIAEIPNQNEETKAGEIGLLTGWGLYGSGSPISKRLRKVNQTIVDIKECKKVHELPILESNICAGDPEGGKGQCNADSGGPLFVSGKVVGIVSWSVKPCGIKGFPGVFTRVASYREWILEQTGV